MALNDLTGNNQANGGNGFGQGYMQQPIQPQQEQMLINYNEKHKNDQPILFRDNITQQLLSVLIGVDKPNALLIGSNGVGKTKIVEDLARRFANNDSWIPDQLTNYKIFELPLQNLVAGSGIVGELEEKVNAIIEFASDPDMKVILFIDEIHQLAGNREQAYAKIAQVLKPALSRGNIKTIGATTTQEAKQFLEDPALQRRFSQIIVDEFTNEQTEQILEMVLPKYKAHFGNKVDIPQDLIPTIVETANEYAASTSHRPDTALTLLDRTMAELVINQQIQIDQAEKDGNTTLAQFLKTQTNVPMRERHLLKTAKTLLRGNASDLDPDVNDLEQTLKSNIYSQDDVIQELIQHLKRKSLKLFEEKTPSAFLFAGKSGTGKTEITKILSKHLTDLDPIILNMTEFHDAASINRIIGSPAGYVGSTSNAELPFDSLATNPVRVVLLDEFEKADKSVQRLFMSALDEGYIKTNRNTTIDFSRAIIIATTNAGQTNIEPKIGFNQTPSPKEKINELTQYFDTELLNRFKNNVYVFNPITKKDYKTILENLYEKMYHDLKPSYQAKCEYPLSKDTLDQLVETSYNQNFNARPAKPTVKRFIEDALLK